MRSPHLRYVRYEDLDGAPNVVVDGSPAEGTVLCLTHWPGIGSPAEFTADLSAEMAFLYQEEFDRHPGATAVSNNHFDQDGLVSVFALAAPEEATARRELLTDVARAGDFATYGHREAARVSMVIAAYATPERSPVEGLAANYGEMTAQLYTELLGRLPELCDHPERSRRLWGEEDAALTASEAVLASGAVVIDEVPDIDLAVVTIPAGAPAGGGHRFGGYWVNGLHPMALYNATDRFVILTLSEDAYELTYRYESWVQYRSRPVRPRRDLAPLVEQLNAEESGEGRWEAEGVSALTPTMQLGGAGASSLTPERVRSLVEAHLRSAPAAWDPYAVNR